MENMRFSLESSKYALKKKKIKKKYGVNTNLNLVTIKIKFFLNFFHDVSPIF